MAMRLQTISGQDYRGQPRKVCVFLFLNWIALVVYLGRAFFDVLITGTPLKDGFPNLNEGG